MNVAARRVDFKLVAVGESGAGKTALLRRFVDNAFSPSFVSTIGIDMHVRDVTVDERVSKLQLWDTAGQERFRTITSAFYRGAHGVLVVFDVASTPSFESVTEWVATARQHCTSGARIVLVGTKCDLASERVVARTQMQELATRLSLHGWCEVSAATGDGVSECFEEMVRALRHTQQAAAEPEPEVLQLEDATEEPRKDGCCK